MIGTHPRRACASGATSRRATNARSCSCRAGPGLPREATPGRSYIYGSSKAALNSAARCLALDLAPEGVIAALVNPGHVQTGIGGAQRADDRGRERHEGARA